MGRIRRGISLVELLVITGVVVVLGATLFPVARLASPATGESASLGNLRLLERGMRLYDADYDQTRVGRQSDGVQVCLSWKQLLDPYVGNHDYLNVGNPADAFADGFSDPAVRTLICAAGTADATYTPHKRGFYWNNIFGPRQGGSYWDQSGLKISTIANPATTGDISEAKDLFTDEGPFSQWVQDVDSSTSWLGAGAPVTGLQWNLYGDHYKNAGMNAAYVDGHAGFVAYPSLCAPWLKVKSSSAIVTNSHAHTFWGFSFDDIVALGSGSSWMQSAVEGYCVSMPTPAGRRP